MLSLVISFGAATLATAQTADQKLKQIERRANARTTRIAPTAIPARATEAAMAVEKEPKPEWSFGLTLGTGYDSNPDADATEDGSPFGHLTGSAGVEIPLAWKAPKLPGTVSLSYEADYKFFEGGFRHDNTLSQTFKGELVVPLTKELSVVLTGADVLTHLDGDVVSNTVLGSPGLTYEPATWLELGTSWGVSTTRNDITPELPEQNPDDTRHTFTGTVAIGPEGLGLADEVATWFKSLEAGYSHDLVYATGDDYDGDRDTVEVKLTVDARKLTEGLSVAGSFRHEWGHYDNPNSRLGFLARRSDEIDNYGASIAYDIPTRCLPDWWPKDSQPQLAVSYDVLQQASNVELFDFNENTLEGSLTLKF